MATKNTATVLRYARYTAALLGMAHFATMLLFINGPELAPLVADIVDYPAALLTFLIMPSGCDSRVSMTVNAAICSVLYPMVLYYLFKLGWKRLKSR